MLKFYYKLIHKNIPQYFYTNMSLAQHSHIHYFPTQNNKNILAPKIRHDLAIKCIRYSTTQIVSTSPIYITDKMYSHSLHGFSRYIKIMR